MGSSKQILVKSLIGASYFTCDVPWACISIVTEPGTWPVISTDHRMGLLQLAFADIGNVSGDEPKAFTEDHAHRVWDFVKALWSDIDVLMVHCEEGNSRGPAVAAAVTRRYLGENRWYFLPHVYWPNKHVYGVLLKVAQQRGELREG
ncbi:MAG: hypothetical protein FJ276_16230 [Planctomycetes bacterium]|nr:hypothetical protein [Planctomycetota bacterium]